MRWEIGVETAAVEIVLLPTAIPIPQRHFWSLTCGEGLF